MSTAFRLSVLVLAAVLLVGCAGPSDVDVDTAVDRLASGRTDDWGCGHGFTIGTPDQTLRLSLWAEDPGDEGPEPGTFEVGPGGDWTGELVLGRDLFAQWCDDVMEPDEPDVVRIARHDVSGTLTWSAATDRTSCPSVATGRFTEGVVTVDGRTVPLPDLEVHNDAFGCVAG